MADKVRAGCKCVKPLLSANFCEAHTRVIGLYRAYYRFIPHLLRLFDIPKTEEDCRWKLREQFYKNACVTDIRVIDMLVIKGYMNLKEMTNNWQQKGHLMSNWNPTAEPKPCDFVGKFLAGVD
ncbi:NADH dehydrogenase [ubiquinone] 1 alpha subcomplex subunit 6-like [Colias croceus]|uniref:NADH dehydrogenase [ubiquinone] 1 alpha subcomplex subunit 6-like n=1 Tax=Colias crocea TaxID=72248 RepID=UPI001E27D6C5|nr:NADH dehydrogenase [ubiquinone] 1 alpha subcomplex subunit 6-like [Colias croceus]